MRNAFEVVQQLAAHDPLITSGLLVLSLLIVPLGGMHVLWIFGRFLVVVIQEFKHEINDLAKVVGRAWRELTTWNEGRG